MQAKAQLKQITEEEFASLKQGMQGEFRRLDKEVVPKDENGDLRKAVVGVDFAQIERADYIGEVGKKDGDIYYHFFPTMRSASPDWMDAFSPYIAAAYSRTFPVHEGMWDYCPEIPSPADQNLFGSIVLRVTGAADNLFADGLMVKLFLELDLQLLSR